MRLPKSKQTKINLLLSALLILGASFFVIEKVFFSQNENVQSVNEQPLTDDEQSELEGNDEGESNLDETTNAPETPNALRETKNYVVDAAICDTECVQYQSDQEALTYCQAVCGLPSSEGTARPNPGDCESATAGVNRDICLRDKAVADNNAELCEDITDKSLRESCRNRIAEERFD